MGMLGAFKVLRHQNILQSGDDFILKWINAESIVIAILIVCCLDNENLQLLEWGYIFVILINGSDSTKAIKVDFVSPTAL